jgi:hypothetical protein
VDLNFSRTFHFLMVLFLNKVSYLSEIGLLFSHTFPLQFSGLYLVFKHMLHMRL